MRQQRIEEEAVTDAAEREFQVKTHSLGIDVPHAHGQPLQLPAIYILLIYGHSPTPYGSIYI